MRCNRFSRYLPMRPDLVSMQQGRCQTCLVAFELKDGNLMFLLGSRHLTRSNEPKGTPRVSSWINLLAQGLAARSKGLH